MLLEIFADGSATVATKPGGYGWVLVQDGVVVNEGNGHIPFATNNDAEMEAAIRGMVAAMQYLMWLKTEGGVSEHPEVQLRCDSQIILNWANGTSEFKQKSKIEQYERLRALFMRLKAKSVWVRGHSGHVHNERCDTLANLGRNGYPADTDPAILKKKPTKRTRKIGKRTEGVILHKINNKYKIIDLTNNLIEDYDSSIHADHSHLREVFFYD